MTAPRVLVVDDKLMNLELVSYLLGADAWDVDIAMDAFDAQRRVIEASTFAATVRAFIGKRASGAAPA